MREWTGVTRPRTGLTFVIGFTVGGWRVAVPLDVGLVDQHASTSVVPFQGLRSASFRRPPLRASSVLPGHFNPRYWSISNTTVGDPHHLTGHAVSSH